MTKKELEEIRPLRTEIKLIKKELSSLPTVADAVTGSRKCPPYDKHVIRIEGVDEVKASRLKNKLSSRVLRLQQRLDELEAYIDTVEDSEMRTILSLRYRRGMSWQQIAFEIGGYDEGIPRKKLERFLKASEKSETQMIL